MIQPTKEQELLAFYEIAMPGFLEYMRAHIANIEDVELATKKDGIVSFPATQVIGGVVKTVRVPLSVITADVDAAETLCRELAEYAQQQGDYAKAQAAHAKEEGDYAAEQGAFANQQGTLMESLRGTVSAWYPSFKSTAETWLGDTQSAWDAWLPGTKSAWTVWFSARKEEWTAWYASTVSDWDAWLLATKSSWTNWYSATVSEWGTWFQARKEEWTAWYTSTVSEWGTWFQARKNEWQRWLAETRQWFSEAKDTVAGWASKEEERQSAEEVRLEMMAHPPIPSESGYWMFWDIASHAYVESGYSSRGTLDWPEFFWDYSCMGIGVVTTRDYSRFTIDEQGRFKMKM
ncbi:MAG: hypothetical protein IJ868_00500 [Prevotella sp.]|nr:hypothetical protein [Prevotella sp.]